MSELCVSRPVDAQQVKEKLTDTTETEDEVSGGRTVSASKRARRRFSRGGGGDYDRGAM
jgi:hypothetical protein